MNILNKLTIQNLRMNRKRTIVTIIGIILSVALITAVASMFFSCRESLILFEKQQKGDYHLNFNNVPKEDIKYFQNNRNFETTNYINNIGYALLTESKNDYKPYAYVMAFTPPSIKNLSIELIDGNIPKNDTEILIPEHLKSNGRIEYHIGDTITLDIGKRIAIDEEIELDQNNPYQKDNEKIIDTISKTYKIVGIIKRPTSNIETFSAPGYSFITYLDESNLSEKNNIYIRLTKEGLKNRWEVMSSLTGVDAKYYETVNDQNIYEKENFEELLKEAFNEISNEKYKTGYNNYLIILETELFGESILGTLVIAAGIVCVIIIFTSVFCIKNSFDISITEKTRQYGMLSSIGATHSQIKKNVFYEALILAIIGIPLGILLGIFASFILIIISNIFIKDMMNIQLVFSLSWIAIIFAILLGIITIYLSAISSARRASKINPITAIRGNNDIKITSKKIKSPKYIKKIFGIGGEISYKNIKRNKKKYRTTVISIIVCTSIFIALSYFINIAFVSVKSELGDYDYNIVISYNPSDKDLENKAHSIVSLDNIKNYSIIREEIIYLDKPDYSKEIEELYPDIGKETSYVNSLTNETVYYTPKEILTVYALGEKAYNDYIRKLGLNNEETKNKGILLNYVYDWKNGEEVTIPRYNYKIGSKLNLYTPEDPTQEEPAEKEYAILEISSITNERPIGLGRMKSSQAMLIVSDELYNKIFTSQIEKAQSYRNNNEKIYLDAENPDELQAEIDNILDNFEYDLTNVAENAQMMKSFYTLIAIFLYGFIIVIALIGITNIFNTITTSMELRKQEFAMLKSIGMTNKEFNYMIRLESLLYGIKSLIIGIPIGIILSYLLYYVLSEGDSSIKFTIPYVAILINIVVVFLLLLILMKYSINKINKQNTIETIRNENI